MNRTFFLVLCICSMTLKGQEMVLSGVIQSDGEQLPFATIGILNKNIGTITDVKGGFKLMIPASSFEDTLIVSYLGYKSKSFIPIKIQPRSNWQINLEKDVIELRPVIVVDKRAKRWRRGGKKLEDTFVWVSAQGKGAEVATLIKTKSPIYLNHVGVQIMNEDGKPFKLLLNLYKSDPITQLPGKSLLQREILIESDQKEGWLDVSVELENIIADGPFYVSFKWVDVAQKRPQIAINDKLTSRTRYVALGEWIELFNWNIRAEGVIIRTN